jgi:hypothetical protein
MGGNSPLTCEQVRRTIERQSLGAAEHYPLPVGRNRTIGDPIDLAAWIRLTRCAYPLEA